MDKAALRIVPGEVTAEPIIAEEMAETHLIVGIDTMYSNLQGTVTLLKEGLTESKRQQAYVNAVEGGQFAELFEKLFKDELSLQTKCTIAKHEIVTGDTAPVVQRNLQIPKYWEHEIDAEIQKLLRAKIIRESESA